MIHLYTDDIDNILRPYDTQYWFTCYGLYFNDVSNHIFNLGIELLCLRNGSFLHFNKQFKIINICYIYIAQCTAVYIPVLILKFCCSHFLTGDDTQVLSEIKYWLKWDISIFKPDIPEVSSFKWIKYHDMYRIMNKVSWYISYQGRVVSWHP